MDDLRACRLDDDRFPFAMDAGVLQRIEIAGGVRPLP
jgi:hypothetical protein